MAKTPEERRLASQASCRRYAQENKEKERQRRKKYKDAHKEQSRHALQAWRAAHPERKNSWYWKNREAILAKKKVEREADPEKFRVWRNKTNKKNREKIAAKRKLYNEAHKNDISQYRKKRWIENREQEQAWARAWQKNNPETIKAYALKRRAAKINAGGSVTAAEIADLWKKQDGKCAYFSVCGNLLKKGRGSHLDHVEPLVPRDKSRPPGTNTIQNMMWLCQGCNSKKNNKDPYKFTQEHEGRLFPDLPQVPKKGRAGK
jgi:5-methylcytosine-specific restriction endonuclease McrA